ncbi:hypothetical protein ABPG75_001856 [Micractinium tetrahymenae]
MVTSGGLEAVLAACDAVVDSEELQEYKRTCDNAAMIGKVAETTMALLSAAFLHGVLKATAGCDSHPVVAGLRPRLLPRLRKYLLHPSRAVHMHAGMCCFALGCIPQAAMEHLGQQGPASALVRLLARVMDPTARHVLQVDGLRHLPPGTLIDLQFPPMFDPLELRMCDACGRHNHFVRELGQQRVKLMRCGGCLERRYCGPECAKKHWSVHKPNCMAIQHKRKQQAEQAAVGAGQAAEAQQAEQPSAPSPPSSPAPPQQAAVSAGADEEPNLPAGQCAG